MSLLISSFPTLPATAADRNAGHSATSRQAGHRRKRSPPNVAKRVRRKGRHDKLLAKKRTTARQSRNRYTPYTDEIVSWWRFASLASLTALGTLMAWVCLWFVVWIWGVIEIITVLPQLR